MVVPIRDMERVASHATAVTMIACLLSSLPIVVADSSSTDEAEGHGQVRKNIGYTCGAGIA